jgi:hypothetical protein
MATSENTQSNKLATKVLGVDKRFLYKSMKRWVRMLNLNMPLWGHEECLHKSNFLAKNVKEIIKSWWILETTISPNKKDIV